MNLFRANLLSFLALAALILTSALLAGQLPDEIPTRFSFDGELLDSRPKWLVLILMPSVYLGSMVAINLLVRISPQKFSMPNSKHAMDIIVFGLGIMLVFMHYGMLMNDGDYNFLLHYFSIGVALALMVMGNVLGKTERNFMIGIRLPWTIDTDANWRATHRLCGKLMVVSGVLLFVASWLFTSLTMLLVLALNPLLIASVYSIVYYYSYERDQQQSEQENEPGAADMRPE